MTTQTKTVGLGKKLYELSRFRGSDEEFMARAEELFEDGVPKGLLALRRVWSGKTRAEDISDADGEALYFEFLHFQRTNVGICG
jgi:hypothetical protein